MRSKEEHHVLFFYIPKFNTYCWLFGQIIIFHQPRFAWNKDFSLPQLPFEVRSCEVAMIWVGWVTHPRNLGYTVDGSEILHHLGWCWNPKQKWDKLPTSTGFLAGFLVAINKNGSNDRLSCWVEAATFQGSDFCGKLQGVFFELLLFFAHSSVDAILGESFRPWKNQPLEVRRFRNWKSIIFGGSMLNFVLGGVRFLSSTLGCPRKLGSMVSKWVVTYL